MTKQNVNAYKVGRVLVIGSEENGAKYTIKSVNGDSLVCAFEREGVPSMELPMTKESIEKLLATGKLHWADEESAPAGEQPMGEDAVEEVNAEDVGNGEPEPTPEPAPRAKKPSPKKSAPKATAKAGRYAYGEYETKRGKTAPKVMGFAEDDEVYQNAALIGGAKSWEYVKVSGKKTKVFTIIFGTRWCDYAHQLVDALNRGADLEELEELAETAKAANDAARAAQKEEYFERKAKRQEEKSAKAAKNAAKGAAAKGEKMYTEAEVKERIRKAFEALANALNLKVSDLEPLIDAA